MKILFALIFFILLPIYAFADCKYYAFVDYGPAMVNGQLNNKENVYRSSGIRKYENGFKAAYTDYGQIQSGQFKLVNIGPYDTEIVAYDALKSTIDDLKNTGYKEKTSNHSLPAILLLNKTDCK